MNGFWTFSNLENDWVHDSYLTKEEAIQVGKYMFDGNYLVGQLNGDDEELTYLVDKVEEITF